MEKNISYHLMNRELVIGSLIFLITVISLESFGQKATDFSGKWILDNSKSSSVYSTLASTVIISQKDNVIDFNITLIPKDGNLLTIHEKYIIGTSSGEVTESKSASKEAALSSDKKTLSITEVVTYTENEITKESRKIKVYSLSDDGNTLTVKSDQALPEGSPTPESERHTVMVYTKSL
jgi:hypothetical protein